MGRRGGERERFSSASQSQVSAERNKTPGRENRSKARRIPRAADEEGDAAEGPPVPFSVCPAALSGSRLCDRGPEVSEIQITLPFRPTFTECRSGVTVSLICHYEGSGLFVSNCSTSRGCPAGLCWREGCPGTCTASLVSPDPQFRGRTPAWQRRSQQRP